MIHIFLVDYVRYMLCVTKCVSRTNQTCMQLQYVVIIMAENMLPCFRDIAGFPVRV